ncbi:SDR family NAD(P)-dependent oxidoreductase [Shimia sp. R11_0]|uniref:SDR family NAD(P)-dependent oxidoreductase n=1 Tax=Shimia sp. R11_0 TaxID=2821096 RepID=UPI001ADAB548|nr:SDR family NAD(P)-dependent oxidoreductase [Shimia sp. R11_0]MBO9478419.1 SDR family NAD(P)-dependent oxidoreductase [Shimia sp. R11_0]
MTHFKDKTFWLVGASEGLGRALAEKLSAEGAHLVISARNGPRLASLAAGLPNTRVLILDVTDDAAVKAAANSIGHLDGVIYNAGAYEPMSAKQWQQDTALRVVDVNLMGAMRALGAVMPKFVAQNSGDITLIGSLAGYRGLPKAIGYGASKAAIVSLAETMRHDLKDSNITVRLANPGFIKTRLTDKNAFKMPMLMTPDEAAEHVLRAMRGRRFRTDFPRPFSWALKLLHILPDWMIYRGK